VVKVIRHKGSARARFNRIRPLPPVYLMAACTSDSCFHTWPHVHYKRTHVHYHLHWSNKTVTYFELCGFIPLTSRLQSRCLLTQLSNYH